MSENGHATGDDVIDASGAHLENEQERLAFSKVVRRLVPILFAGYAIAYLDRVNVGFAKLQMAGDLQFSDAVYGFGAGIFFLGYFLFEVPSNLVLRRVGARRWIARIMISWGMISAGFMFVGDLHWGPVSGLFGISDTEFSFFLFRFLLGVAEAGFYPGVIFYLTCWFPPARRAQVIAMFMASIPITAAVGAPLNGAIMQYFNGIQDMRGWQWLFLLEGLPAVFLGFFVLARLPDSPQEAKWLSTNERSLIEARLAVGNDRKSTSSHHEMFLKVLTDWRIWLLIVAYFCANIGGYATSFWGPTIVQEIGIDSQNYLFIGLLMILPYGGATLIMLIWARHSDKTGERKWHSTLAALLLATGLLLLALAGDQPIPALLGIGLVTAGMMTWLSIFWSIPTAFLSGSAAAGGIALINAFANLGGYIGPGLVGSIRDANGGDATQAFLVLGGFALITAVLSFYVTSRNEVTTIRR